MGASARSSAFPPSWLTIRAVGCFSLVCMKRWVFSFRVKKLHLCIVFHSTRDPIIPKRCAYKLRMLQEHDKTKMSPTIFGPLTTTSTMHNSPESAVLHKLYSEHIRRQLIGKTHTHRSTKKINVLIFLWNEDEMKRPI